MMHRIARLAAAAALLLHVVAVGAVVDRALAFRSGGRPKPTMVLRLFNDVTHRAGPGSDFFALYHAGVEVRRSGDVYAWKRADGTTPYFYAYRYMPPLAQTAGRLVTLLPPWSAYFAWLAVLELLLGTCVAWALRHLEEPLGWWSAALLLGSTPYWLELNMGQFSFFTAVLLFWGGVWLGRGRVGASLAAWAGSVFVKVYPLVALPVWLRVLRWPAALALLGTMVGGGLVAYGAQPESWKRFLSLNLGQRWFFPDAGNFALTQILGQILVLGVGASEQTWAAAASALRVLALGGASLLALFRGRSRPVLALVMMMLAHQVSYREVWEHHYSLVIPLGVLLLTELTSHRDRAAVLGCLALVAAPTPFIFWDVRLANPSAAWSLPQQMTLPALKAIPTLALLLLSGTRLARDPTPAAARG